MYVLYLYCLLAIQLVSAVEYTDLVDTSKPNKPVSLNETDFADIDEDEDFDVKQIIIKELEKDGKPIDEATLQMINDPLYHGGKIQGDMDMDEDYALNNRSAEMGLNAIINMDKKKYWPNAVVPYMVSGQYGQKGRQIIAVSAAQFAKYTCTRFIPRTNEKDYVYIEPKKGCFSRIGKDYYGGSQTISLPTACLHKAIVVHEMMHTLGLYHEQARSDRDNYIVVMYDNIQKSEHDQYDKKDTTEASLLGLPYDQKSLMHYTDKAFWTYDAAVAGRRTMISKTGEKQFSNEHGFTELDIRKINKMYGCPNRAIPRPVPADTTTTVAPTQGPPTGGAHCKYDSVAGSTRIAGPGWTSIFTTTPDKCCQKCRSKSKCKAFTWTASNSVCTMHGTGYRSNIKNDCGTDCWFAVIRAEPTTVVSPVRPANERCTYDCAGCGKRGTASGLVSMETYSPDDCCNECRKRSQCKAFTWTYNDSMCWLHTAAYKNNIKNDCGTKCWFSQM